MINKNMTVQDEIVYKTKWEFDGTGDYCCNMVAASLLELARETRKIRMALEGINQAMRANRKKRPGQQIPASKSDPLLLRPIKTLGTTGRCFRALFRAHIESIGKLVSYSEYDLLKIKGFGLSSLREIKDALTELGLNLAQNNGEVQ